jgi:hypothetical protein
LHFAIKESRLFTGLTHQNSFLQMSGMTFGSIVEADRRLRIHGAWQRQQKKVIRDAEVWRRYEEDYDLQSRAAQRSQPVEETSPEGKSE